MTAYWLMAAPNVGDHVTFTDGEGVQWGGVVGSLVMGRKVGHAPAVVVAAMVLYPAPLGSNPRSVICGFPV